MVPSALVGITSLEQKIAKDLASFLQQTKTVSFKKFSTNPVVFLSKKFFTFQR